MIDTNNFLRLYLANSRLNILSDVPRLELRLFWEIHSAGVDFAVQSRVGLRLWEITSAVVDDADG